MSKSTESFLDTKTGFAFTAEGRRREFQDQDIRGIRVESQRQANSVGGYDLIKRLHFRVGDTEWATVESELGPYDRDDLLPIEIRVIDRLVESARETLLHGGDVEGDSWSLNLIELSVPSSDLHCPLQQISAVTWDGDRLCIWHEDQRDRPVARLPRDSENTIVLHRLLTELVNGVEPDPPGVANIGLGPRLAVYHTWHHPINARWLLAPLGALLAGLLVASPIQIVGMFLLLILVVTLMFYPTFRGHPETLSHYQQGIVWSRGGSERVLLLKQIKTLAVEESARESDIAGNDPRARLRIEPVDGSEAPIQIELTTDAARSLSVNLQERRPTP